MIALTALATLAMAAQSYSWHDIVQPSFQDCTFVAKGVKGNQAELRKINAEFGSSYRFSYMKAKIKEPFMMRVESRVEDTDLLYIENGGRRLYRIPAAHISHVDDVSHAPGKRQTVLDFGILTPSLFQNYFNATFVHTDRATGDLVFDLTYVPALRDKSRHRVWVDPTRHYVTKRVWFAQDGRLMATFLYTDPKDINGVWFPTKATVVNVDDKVAGITAYTSIEANTGLSNDLFKF
jgi:outer membrane lipoprotein-sorting protein